MSDYRIGADIGGTFTDIVAFDAADRSLRWANAPSTPNEPATGMLDAVPALTGDISDGHGRTDPTHNGPSGEYPTRGGKSIRRLRRRP